MNEIKAECKTCKNPYCSRTLEERRKQEVTHHFQYGWECSDKEKYLQNDGGFALVKKKELEEMSKYLFPKNKVVSAIAHALYYTANPDSEMCIPNCAFIQAEKAPIFSMFEKKSGAFIGNIELMDVHDATGELGIAITAEKQGLGYGTEAIPAMIEYGARSLGLHRITLRAFPDNTRAIHVYEKCGFREYDRTAEDVFMEITR